MGGGHSFAGVLALYWAVTIVVVVITAAVSAAVVVTAAAVHSIKATSRDPRVDRQCVQSASSAPLIAVKRRVLR